MLTLGLPTSATAAIMLSAFQSYGINPGPLLLQSQPQLVWGLIASLFIGNVMLLVLNLPLIAIWVKLLQIPAPLLCRYSRVRHHRHLWDHPVSGRPDPALSHRRDRLPHAALRLPGRARHHRDDPGAARGAELPSGHDNLGRRLDGVLHAPAVGDDPGAGGARVVRAQALSARHAAQAGSRAGRRVSNKMIVSNLAAIAVRFRSQVAGCVCAGGITPPRRRCSAARDCRIP